MSGYLIGAYGFIRWEGIRPQFVKQHVVEFRRIGQNGLSAQLQGITGDPFDVTLTAVYASEAATRIAEVNYRNLIGLPQVLVHEGVNYYSAYRHQYLVHDVQVTEAKSHPRLIGPTYDFVGGWRLVSQWNLIPVT